MSVRCLSTLLLYESPELPTLDTLRAVLDVARMVLLAAHPDLDADEMCDGRAMLPTQTWLADALLRDLDALRAALERYCDAVHPLAHAAAHGDDEDIDF